MNLKHVFALVLKDAKTEYRNKYIFGSILLFVVVSSYIIYKSFQSLSVMSWNVLFWIIFLFAALNALVRSFSQEQKNQFLYYYQLVDPSELIVSKLIYNIITLCLVAFALFVSMSLFTINPVVDKPLFVLTIVLASVGVSVCFTFVAAILSVANNQSSLMAVLALPLVIPILLLLIKISANALGIVEDSSVSTDLWLLLGIDFVLFGMALLIYPVLWRS